MHKNTIFCSILGRYFYHILYQKIIILGNFCSKISCDIGVILANFWSFLRGLAFRHNSKRSHMFYWETLVESLLPFAARHQCSTPHLNTCFWKNHIMPKPSNFEGGLTPRHNMNKITILMVFE